MQLLDGTVVEMDNTSRGLILESLREMSRSALRCLGFAYKDEIPEFATYDILLTSFCLIIPTIHPLRTT